MAHHIGHVAAALTQKPYRPRVRGEVGDQAYLPFGIVDAQAVGADYADVTLPRDGHQPVLEFDSLGFAGLRVAGGEDMDHLDPHAPALLHDGWRVRSRNGEDNVIHRSGDVFQAAVDRQPRHLAAPGIDQVDLAGIAALDQGIQIEPPDPDLGQISRDAHHGHGAGMEDVVQGMRCVLVVWRHSCVQAFTSQGSACID